MKYCPLQVCLHLMQELKPLLEESFAASNGSQSHSYLELLNDEDISGIEVEVQLPSDASTSTGIGLYASDWAKTFSEDQSENSFFGLDLRSDHIDIEYTDPNSGSLVSSELPTELGRSHIFAFIFEEPECATLCRWSKSCRVFFSQFF